MSVPGSSSLELPLGAALDAALDAFHLFRAVRDPAGDVVDLEWIYVNPAGAAMLGRPAVELVGARFLDRHPEHRDDGLFEAYLRVLRGGAPADVEVCRPGRWPGAGDHDRWFRHVVVRAGDHLASTVREVTPRRLADADRDRALEAARDAEERLRTVLENLPIGVWFADADGVIRFGNPAGQRIWAGAR